jgi:hypothetical protein
MITSNHVHSARISVFQRLSAITTRGFPVEIQEGPVLFDFIERNDRQFRFFVIILWISLYFIAKTLLRLFYLIILESTYYK